MSNQQLASAIPTFSSREIFKSFITLDVDFNCNEVGEHIINVNEYCRLSLLLEGRTPFYSTWRMDVSDSNISMFEMVVRVYPRHQTAYAITLEQSGTIRKKSIGSDGCWLWSDHDEINKFLQEWLAICVEAKPGPVASLYIQQMERDKVCII